MRPATKAFFPLQLSILLKNRIMRHFLCVMLGLLCLAASILTANGNARAAGQPLLTIAFTAETRGNYDPCPS